MIELTNESKNYINKFINKTNVKDSKYYKQLYTYLNSYYTAELPKYSIKQVSKKHNILEYIPTSLVKSIHRLKKYHIVKTDKITMHIYHNINLDNFVKIALTYIQFMYKLSGSTKDMTITYYLINNKKIQKNNILTRDEVNTGLTDLSNIYIWRLEEVFKTTIHECIHFFELDYKDTEIVTKHYTNKYECTSDTIKTYEGYVDFWAILINSFLATKLLNNPYKFFVNAINLEKTFIEHQSHKILRLNKNYNKYTPVLSYYVIKAELFLNLPKTLKILDKIQVTNEYFEYLLKLPIITPTKKINDTTLRMSIIEIA